MIPKLISEPKEFMDLINAPLLSANLISYIKNSLSLVIDQRSSP
jgi:hypothetical protein